MTEREKKVLKMMAEGLTNAEIGKRLGLSKGRVGGIIHEIANKLGRRDRVSVVLEAIRQGIIRVSGVVQASAEYNTTGTIDGLLDDMGDALHSERATPPDRALWHLLKKNSACLPDPDERFHKTFRQADVTGSGHEDMAIWHLLQCSPLFWDLFNKAGSQE